MTPAQRAARVYFLAKQCRGEADRQSGAIRQEMLNRSRQLSYAFTSAYSQNPDVQAQLVALIEATVDALVDIVTARTERELAKGKTP
jgi:hypothetical protein